MPSFQRETNPEPSGSLVLPCTTWATTTAKLWHNHNKVALTSQDAAEKLVGKNYKDDFDWQKEDFWSEEIRSPND